MPPVQRGQWCTADVKAVLSKPRGRAHDLIKSVIIREQIVDRFRVGVSFVMGRIFHGLSPSGGRSLRHARGL